MEARFQHILIKKTRLSTFIFFFFEVSFIIVLGTLGT